MARAQPDRAVPVAQRPRNAENGRVLLGLKVDVPWSAWEGYEPGMGFETGIVFEYQAQPPGRFIVRFPAPMAYAATAAPAAPPLAMDVCGVCGDLEPPRPRRRSRLADLIGQLDGAADAKRMRT